MTTKINPLATRLKPLLEKINAVSKAHNTQKPTLIAVTKTRKIGEIGDLSTFGILDIGENYLQELEQKEQALPNYKVHFIGHIQSKKLKKIIQLSDVLHTLSSEKHIYIVDKTAKELKKPMDCFIQINIGNEEQKSGVSIDSLEIFVNQAREADYINLLGFMCIPPAGADAEPYFAKMKQLKELYNVDCLSMGMSRDWETAIKYGATHIRLGTSIFGPRPPKK